MHPSTVAPSNLNLQVDFDRLIAAHETVRAELLGERTVAGHWVGEPSSSPLATAAAVCAMVIAGNDGSFDVMEGDKLPERSRIQDMLQGGISELVVESLHWLAERQNEDGGWGDTEQGRSNVAATLIVQSAFRMTGVPAKYEGLTDRATNIWNRKAASPHSRNAMAATRACRRRSWRARRWRDWFPGGKCPPCPSNTWRCLQKPIAGCSCRS